MSQTFNTLSNDTLIGELDDKLNENFATLRTLFSGTTAPASPATYQLWLDTSGATPRLKAYTGAAWVDVTDWLYVFQTNLAEVVAARGAAASLDARLDVAINEDGTLKAGLPAGGWWSTEADAVAFNDASSFTVAGDKTAVYTALRAVHLDQTADVYGHVVSSIHAAGTTTVTVDCTVDAGLTSVEYGQPVENDTAIPQASATVQGKVELATDAETQAGTDAERAITPASLSARTATDARAGIAELATSAEVQTGTDATRIVTPSGLSARTATTTRTGVIATATQAVQELASAADVAVTPNVQHFHPAAAKGWAFVTNSGSPTLSAGYNVLSLTDHGPGDVSVNWDVDFSSANYAAVYSCAQTDGAFNAVNEKARAAGSIELRFVKADAGLTTVAMVDCNFNVAAFGDQ